MDLSYICHQNIQVKIKKYHKIEMKKFFYWNLKNNYRDNKYLINRLHL